MYAILKDIRGARDLVCISDAPLEDIIIEVSEQLVDFYCRNEGDGLRFWGNDPEYPSVRSYYVIVPVEVKKEVIL